MNNLNFIIKRTLLIILIIVTASLIAFSVKEQYERNNKTTSKAEKQKEEIVNKDSEYCYYRSNELNSGSSDVSWLRIKESKGQVSGEMRNLPAETDSKVGLFEGNVVGYSEVSMLKKANVIWNAMAEGMENREELEIDYGNDYAIAYFGEVVDRGDGVYVFKDKKNLYPQDKMMTINCLDLEEKINVEKYVRENIKLLSEKKEVLGGSWYVIKIKIDTQNNKGEVLYEDGHILEKASFKYDYSSNLKLVSITDFK